MRLSLLPFRSRRIFVRVQLPGSGTASSSRARTSTSAPAAVSVLEAPSAARGLGHPVRDEVKHTVEVQEVQPEGRSAQPEAQPSVLPDGAGSGLWDEAHEASRLEAWAQEQQERAERGRKRARERSRRRKIRRLIGLVVLGGGGWAGLNAPVHSLGGTDDTLGHALGRSFNARSLDPMGSFARLLLPGLGAGAGGGALASTGSSRAFSPLDLKGAGALDCDVLVVGATPSGVASALAAARRGAQVIVVDKHPHAGGDVVYAMLNMFDVMARPGETARVHGLFAEFFEQLGVSCDISRARDLFDSALRAEPNIRFVPNVEVSSIYKDGNKLVGIQIQDAKAKRAIACKVLIDATNDADTATMAGSGFYIGREDANPDKKMQSAGLLFSVKNVKWSQVRDYVSGRRVIDMSERGGLGYGIDIAPTSRAQKHRLPGLFSPRSASSGVPSLLPGAAARAVAGAQSLASRKSVPRLGAEKVWLRMGGGMGNYAWERGNIIKGYKAHGPDIVILSINFGRQSDGSVVLNTLNIVNVNGLEPASRRAGREEGIRELPFFLKYLRKTMPGFEKATLAQVAPELYIRETRHIHGHYTLKVQDIRGQAKFFDRIAHAAYPLDLHPYTRGDINPYGPRRYFYTLPLRSLVPRGVDNVFVASRSLSASYSAAGSARVIPVTMAAGEAAGVAAWECARKGKTPHELVKDFAMLREVQDSLRKGGADLGD